MHAVLPCFVSLWKCEKFGTHPCDLSTHIIQDCVTGTGTIYDCPNASGVILKYMGKLSEHRPSQNACVMFLEGIVKCKQTWMKIVERCVSAFVSETMLTPVDSKPWKNITRIKHAPPPPQKLFNFQRYTLVIGENVSRLFNKQESALISAWTGNCIIMNSGM